MDENGLQFREAIRSAVSSAKQYNDMTEQLNKLNAIQIEHDKRIEKREAENHANLESIAQNTGETVDNLKEINALLREQNNNLKADLSKISQILQDLFYVEKTNGEENKALMQQANALACEIAVSLENREKINWKDKAIDGGAQVLIMAINMFLRMNGI